MERLAEFVSITGVDIEIGTKYMSRFDTFEVFFRFWTTFDAQKGSARNVSRYTRSLTGSQARSAFQRNVDSIAAKVQKRARHQNSCRSNPVVQTWRVSGKTLSTVLIGAAGHVWRSEKEGKVFGEETTRFRDRHSEKSEKRVLMEHKFGMNFP